MFFVIPDVGKKLFDLGVTKMRRVKANCFTLEGNSGIRRGIKFSRNGDNCVLTLTASHQKIGYVHIGNSTKNSLPYMDGDMLFRAQPHVKHKGKKIIKQLIRSSASYRQSLLLVKADCLWLPGQPLVEGLNLWPGVECEHPAFFQCGRHSDPKKQQLLVINQYGKVYVADSRTVVKRIELTVNGTMQMAHVDGDEFINYLLGYGERLNTKPSLDWLYYNLRTLGVELPRHIADRRALAEHS